MSYLRATTPRKLAGSRIASHRLAHNPHHDIHKEDPEHITHCFDYIRQGIMCAGDTSLEHAMKEDGKIVPDVDGWGVEHECRDFSAICEWAKENRSWDRKGILHTAQFGQ